MFEGVKGLRFKVVDVEVISRVILENYVGFECGLEFGIEIVLIWCWEEVLSLIKFLFMFFIVRYLWLCLCFLFFNFVFVLNRIFFFFLMVVIILV